MKRWFVLTGVLAFASMVGHARGQDGKPGSGKRPGGKGNMVEMIFKKMDANGDGKLTLEEFKKAVESRPQSKLKDNPEMIAKIFERMDADGDGFVTFAEFKKFREKMAERMKDGKPGAKKPGEKKDDQ